MKLFLILIVYGSLAGAWAHARPLEVNMVQLRGGATLELAAEPEDPELRTQFAQLTPEQQLAFYSRRRFLVEKLVGGFSFPRLIGGLSWAKGKIKRDGDPNAHLPFKERGRLALKTIADVFVEKLWVDSTYVATANAVGFTLYFGPVANASFAKWGYFWGRGLSIDIGHDFLSDKGYVRFYYDKQEMAHAGLSFDVGAMFDFFVHFNTNANSDMQITHYKLPAVGSYRSSPTYRAYGLQLGVNVLEVTAVAVAYKYPEVAAALFMGTRLLGTATVYSTHLKRKILGHLEVPSAWISKCAQALEVKDRSKLP